MLAAFFVFVDKVIGYLSLQVFAILIIMRLRK